MYGSLPDVAGSNELGEYNRFDVKPRKGVAVFLGACEACVSSHSVESAQVAGRGGERNCVAASVS